MTTTSVKYANDEYVKKILNKQTTSQSTINNIISKQSPSDDNYNKLFPIPANLQDLNAAQLREVEDNYKNTYNFGAFRFLPESQMIKTDSNANFTCIVPPENATENTVNLTKIDNGAYHTFNTCSNKAAMLNKKYFSIVKPLPASGVNNSNLYECWVGDDHLRKMKKLKLVIISILQFGL